MLAVPMLLLLGALLWQKKTVLAFPIRAAALMTSLGACTWLFPTQQEAADSGGDTGPDTGADADPNDACLGVQLTGLAPCGATTIEELYSCCDARQVQFVGCFDEGTGSLPCAMCYQTFRACLLGAYGTDLCGAQAPTCSGEPCASGCPDCGVACFTDLLGCTPLGFSCDS